MKTVVIQICAGMGNQMFQYAFGYAYKKKYNVLLKYDLYYAGARKDRQYKLNNFNIGKLKMFVPQFIDVFINVMKNPVRQYDRSRRYIRNIFKYKYIEEEDCYNFDTCYYDIDESKIYLKGLWQSWKYFDEYYNDIKQQLTYKGVLSKKALKYITEMSNNESVAVHIRRTDYIEGGRDNTISLSYYYKAIDFFKEKKDNYIFYFFSDDKEFVKNSFNDTNYKLVSGIDDIEEFECMRACKNHIIANSSFSWWATYLSENKGGNVIAPVKGWWHRDFYLPQWKVIDMNE